MKRAEYKKHARIGCGGWKCACCAPAPGKEKQEFLRQAKKREKRDALRDVCEDIDNNMFE